MFPILLDPTVFPTAKRLSDFPKADPGMTAGPQFSQLKENEKAAEGHFLSRIHSSSTADGTLSFSKATSDLALSQEMVVRIGKGK